MKKVEVRVGDKIGENYEIQDIIKSYKNWFKPVFLIYNKRKKCRKAYTENELLFILKGIKNR